MIIIKLRQLTLYRQEQAGSDSEPQAMRFLFLWLVFTLVAYCENQAAAIADFDRDGFADVAVIRTSDLLMFRGRPGGEFEAPRICANNAPFGALSQAFVVDLEGDGGADLVVLGRGATAWRSGQEKVWTIDDPNLIGLAQGNFGMGPRTLVTASEHKLTFYPLDLQGRLGKPKVVPTPEEVWSLVSADIDLDGQEDLLVGTARKSKRAFILRSTRKWVLESVPFASEVGRVVAADFNGDGYCDLASLLTPFIQLRLGSAQGWQASRRFSGDSVSTLFHGCADFNGDGFSDLAVEVEGGASLFDGDKTRILAPPRKLTPKAHFLAQGDLNGDGLPDLLTGESYRNRLQLWLNGGKSGLQLREISWP